MNVKLHMIKLTPIEASAPYVGPHKWVKEKVIETMTAARGNMTKPATRKKAEKHSMSFPGFYSLDLISWSTSPPNSP